MDCWIGQCERGSCDCDLVGYAYLSGNRRLPPVQRQARTVTLDWNDYDHHLFGFDKFEIGHIKVFASWGSSGCKNGGIGFTNVGPSHLRLCHCDFLHNWQYHDKSSMSRIIWNWICHNLNNFCAPSKLIHHTLQYSSSMLAVTYIMTR